MDTAPQLNQTLQEIIDHHEIRKVLAVYCHGCDRGDEVGMASVYRENSWDDHGDYKGPGKPFAKFVMDSYVASGTKCSHLLGQSLINIVGNEAGAETYFLATVSATDKDGRSTENLLGGRYVDTLLRENGQWKIAKRICVRDWAIGLDVDRDWLKDNNFVRGEQSSKDPSYAVLGLEHPGLPRGS